MDLSSILFILTFFFILSALSKKPKPKSKYNKKTRRKNYSKNNEEFFKNIELTDSVTGYTKANKITKGAIYEAYIADIYRQRGYDVEERGRELGKRDGGIDLIATKEDEVIFIQCKNWKENGKWKIKQKDIKAFRSDIRDFLINNPEYKKDYMIGRYVISGNILHKGAYIYIKQNNHILDFEIIRMQ